MRTVKRGPSRKMFPTKPGSKRVRGIRKKQLAFRPPDDLRAYIQRAEVAGNRTTTEVLIKMLQVARDASEGLGVEWYEIERQAAVEGTTAGVVLARLALAKLKETDDRDRKRPK